MNYARFEDVSFGFLKNKVFEDFNLEIKEGSIYGLLGTNGAGKSTLLYLLAGLLFPQKGRVLYNGMDMCDRCPEALSDMYFVPEEFSLPNMSFKKYIAINSKFYPKFSEEMLTKSLDAFGMTSDINLFQLSMGQKKKAFICFALATNTNLLMMDEPTNGLDIPSKSNFRKAVSQSMTDDRTIIVSTHQVRDVENLLDRVLVLDNSNILLNETIGRITEKLSFVQSMAGQTVEDAIYKQSLMGFDLAVVKNQDNVETQVNMELLFNAVLAERQKIAEIFR